LLDGLEFFLVYLVHQVNERGKIMKFYNKCVCCGKQIEVFPEEYDCLEDLDEPMVCSEECNEEMEAKQWN
jgi:hypothetical protein